MRKFVDLSYQSKNNQTEFILQSLVKIISILLKLKFSFENV